MTVTTPQEEERAARQRERNLEKARRAAAKARDQERAAARRAVRREIRELRREQLRVSTAYERALTGAVRAPEARQAEAFDRADREQSRVLGLGARVRQLEGQA